MKITWSPIALVIVNLLFAGVFYISGQVTAMIPLLFKAGGKEYQASIELLKLVIAAYPWIYGASIVLSWLCFWRKNQILTTVFALMPIVPALVIIFVRIKFSLLQDVYAKLNESVALKLMGLPRKLFPF